MNYILIIESQFDTSNMNNGESIKHESDEKQTLSQQPLWSPLQEICLCTSGNWIWNGSVVLNAPNQPCKKYFYYIKISSSWTKQINIVFLFMNFVN